MKNIENESKHRNDMEIDFIISNNSRLKYKMFPIEVKSGKQYKTTSLDNFREKYRERIGESYIIKITTLIISKKPGNTGISRDIRTEFTTDLLLSD